MSIIERIFDHMSRNTQMRELSRTTKKDNAQIAREVYRGIYYI